MVKQIPAGTLVRPKPGALDPRAEYANYNAKAIEENGYLYFIAYVSTENLGSEEPEDNWIVYMCKSVATGKEVKWIDYELEIAEDG